MIGRTLGQYRVLEALGQGGMGTVYLGEDTHLGRRVAIKVISGAAGGDPEARARFLQEARAASSLDHPNICAIYQIGETDEGAPFLAMAHYDGATLDRRIDAGPVPLGEAVEIAAQVADGLAHAHARGIVHRDIKPSNVLLTRDGVAKILDFGLAKRLGAESLTTTGVSIGTPAYMSPEQVRAEKVDARSDVWAAGVLLYALLAGRSPFDGENLAAVTYAILENEPRPLREFFPRVPEGLQAVLDRCLAKNAADRYPDARALAADLRALAARLAGDETRTQTASVAASGARTLAVPSTPRRRTAGSAPARRLAAPAAAVLALALAAGAIVAWRATHPATPLRVAVLAPEVAGEPDSAAAAVASADAMAAVLRALAALRGVAPLDAASVRGTSGWRQLADALSADEVFTVSLTRSREEWNVALRRIAAADSAVRWAGSFSVARGAALPFLDAVRAGLARAYPDHAPRPGERSSRIGAAEYEEFLELERRFRRNFANDVPRAEMLARFERLRRAAPGYLGVHLLEAEWARYQFETHRAPGDLALALEAAERAARLAPDDPRPYVARINARMLEADWARAGESLQELRRLIPGEPEVDFLAARILEGRGERAAAIEAMKRLVRRRPARHYLERLARMQYNAGHYDDARAVLASLAAQYPDYVFPRSYRAQLELLYGSPPSAESLYAELAERFPRGIYYSNLGLARMLQHDFAGAAEATRRADALQPGDPATLLNLGDCEALLGRHEEAAALYRRVLAMAGPGSSDDWETRLTAAQCLAHLGRREEAVAATMDVLRTEGDNADALFQSSLVCAVSGESASAIVHARRAIELGIQPRWFSLPWFDAVRKDPRFEAALKTTPKPPA